MSGVSELVPPDVQAGLDAVLGEEVEQQPSSDSDQQHGDDDNELNEHDLADLAAADEGV